MGTEAMLQCGTSKAARMMFCTCICIFVSDLRHALSQLSETPCILDLETSVSMFASSGCKGDKGSSFEDGKCCLEASHQYLYALGLRANQTGHLYLNSTEHRSCLSKTRSSQLNPLSCKTAIHNLTGGLGGCSDFSVSDVNGKLSILLESLKEKCQYLNTKDLGDVSCGSCLQSWKDMKAIRVKISASIEYELETCRYAVLLSLVSTRIRDETWVKTFYNCIFEQKSYEDDILEDHVQKHKTRSGAGLVIFAGGIIVFGIVAVALVWTCFRRKTKVNVVASNNEKNLVLSNVTTCLKVPIEQVYSVTNCLHESNFIGEGIAGKVYRGVTSDKHQIAIKHIIKEGCMETFLRKVQSLSHVRHPNLVALLGYSEGKDDCFLICELCPNGNLSEWLFGKGEALSWIQRLEIAVDCARGLQFLHTYPAGCIVHRDIKPTNILLGKNLKAKLSDFELSKVIELGKSCASSEVRCTFGYVDPEYQNNGQVNSSGDVYSFGIVLLQLLSGKKVINMNMRTPMPLDKIAKSMTRKESSVEFADPNLHGDYSVKAFQIVFELALSCAGIKKERPSIELVVVRLEEALLISTRAGALAPLSSPDRSSD